MYDMYPWNNRAESVSAPRRVGQPPEREESAEPAVHAVQVALDRRDNGGDATGVAGQPTVGPTRQ